MSVNEQGVPLIGQVVKILHGREKGQYAVVVSVIDSRYVLLADGSKRTFDCGKKKNVRHILLQDHVSPEIQNSISAQCNVTDAELRYALQRFHLTFPV